MRIKVKNTFLTWFMDKTEKPLVDRCSANNLF